MRQRYKILKAETFDNTFIAEDESGRQHYIAGATVTKKTKSKDEDLVGKEFFAELVHYISAAKNVEFINANKELANGD